MRPRVFPAEDIGKCHGPKLEKWRFNEAAGIPRGRQIEVDVRRILVAQASMRPRVFPAEDQRSERQSSHVTVMLQ